MHRVKPQETRLTTGAGSPVASLVRAAQGGDLGAFDEIVGRFQDMAYASAYSMLGDAQLAEDAAQEAFLEAYLNLAKLHEPAAFPGWFRRIVFKQGDRLTRGKHIPTMPLENAFDMPLADLNPATVVERRETNLLVRRAIEELPDHERTVTLLFYSTGYALKDIAAFLEVPVTTIKKRLHDARKHLKESLVDVVRDTLHEQRRSMMDGFPDKVRLLIAIHMGDIAGVSALLERNAMLVNTKAEWDEQVVRHYGWIGSGLNPLYEAARGGNVAMVKLLLDYGAVIQTRTYNALNGAAYYNREAVVRLLLDHGADANGGPILGGDTEVIWGATPLRMAAMKGHKDIVELLLAHGATVDAGGRSGRTALHWAALKGHRDTVKLLLEYGADVDVLDELGRTALDWAMIRGQAEVVELLRRRAASSSRNRG